MIVRRLMMAAFGGVLFTAAGVAAAGNFSSNGQGDFLSGGTHQFYVLCSTTQDYVATAQGVNAEEAQMKLYDAAKARGNAACWPVWQGRIAAG